MSNVLQRLACRAVWWIAAGVTFTALLVVDAASGELRRRSANVRVEQ
jgi:hypothetical protein